MPNPTEKTEPRQPDQVAPCDEPSAPPTPRELALARGLLAILRTHESAGDPETWTVDPAPWGDGRTTFEVHANGLRSNGTRSRELVCQFRPDDLDGTKDDAMACVVAAHVGLRHARAVIAEHIAATKREATP